MFDKLAAFGLDNLRKYAKLLRLRRAVNMREHKLIVRREPKADSFEIKFKVDIEQLPLSREFNMKRKVDEPLETLLSRIVTNMEKAFGKKIKKTKAKMGLEKGSDEPQNLKITAEIREDGKPVTLSSTCEQFFFGATDWTNVTVYLCDMPFKVVVNLPYVLKLSLPDVIMADLPVFPLKFNVKCGKREHSEFKWFVSSDGVSWTAVGDGLSYKPKKEEVGRLLKLECKPSNGVSNGDVVTAVSPKPVQPSPGVVPHFKRHQHTLQDAHRPEFRVVSYNILADKYAETETANTALFPYCPDFARRWSYRRQLLIDELLGYNADILCLQEVDTKAFEYDLTVMLSDRFKGLFNKKYHVEEGVATFFNRNRYDLVEHDSCYLNLELNTNDLFSDIWTKVESNKLMAERAGGLGTVAQSVVLREKSSTDRIVVVTNTHLYFHPDSDHIRLLQGGLYAKYFTHVVDKTKAKLPNSSISLIVCGDFNSVPSCGIYKLFTTGVAPADLVDWKSKEDEAVSGLELRQPFKLRSAYGEPLYTNFTKEFADCLDYIFYNEDNVKVVRTVPLLSEEELRAHTALPSVVCPSDHMALVADLRWRDL